MIDKELLDILACPCCKGDLELIDGPLLHSPSCGLKFKIEDDIPIMLIDEAIVPEGKSIEDFKK